MTLSTIKKLFSDLLLNHQGVDAGFCINEFGHFLCVNDEMCHLSGYCDRDLEKMTVFAIDIEISSQIWQEIWQVLKCKKSLNLASYYQAKNSQIIPVEISLTLWEKKGIEFGLALVRPNQQSIDFNFQKQPQLVGTKLDNQFDYSTELSSECIKTEIELETSLALLRSTLESTANGILAVNFEGEILCYNQKFIEMWQLPPQAELAKGCIRAKTFFESQVKEPNIFRACLWEMPVNVECDRYDLIELKDGRIFAHYSEPHRLGDKIIGRVWSVWDITESKRTEEALRINEARFRTLAETNEASIFLIQGSRLCYANPAAEILTGYSRQELLSGFPLDKLIKNKRLRQASKNSGEMLCEYREMQILTRDGIERWLACTVTHLAGLFDFGNEPVELVTAIDISDYKQAESEVLQALEQAKYLSELRERFVSMLCHQFRTPLNVVSFSADLLRRHIHQWNHEKNRSYLDLILTAVEQISHLLDDILLFGRADAAKLQCQPRQLDIDKFCRDIIVQVKLASGNQRSIIFINQENFTTACLDPKLLQHILNNLLVNAIKYSQPESTVILELVCQDGYVIFQVKDVGIGIPAVDTQQIFEPFYRGSNVDNITGTGLGLSIVKTLVELHHGKLDFESQVGVGTTFQVTLPT
jgi:PAS domain S-box-containing protein